MVIPHLEDNGRPQGNHSQPGHRPFLKLPLQEHRGQQAHEKGGKLGQDLCIPQGQSVETIEEKQQTGTAEQSPEMEQQMVFSGKHRTGFHPGHKGQQQKPDHAPEERDFPGSQMDQFFGPHIHGGEEHRRQDGSQNAFFCRRQCHHAFPQFSSFLFSVQKGL